MVPSETIKRVFIMKKNDLMNDILGSHFFAGKRFYGAVIALVFLIALSVSAHVAKSNDNDVQSGGNYAEEDESSEYRELLVTYYDGRAAGDIDKVLSVADPVSDAEQSYIKMLADYVDSYEIVDIYTKQGVEEGSCLLSARLKIHFKDIKSAAPGLDFFYVERRDDGSVYINNLYSAYNMQNNENPMEPEVASLIAQFEQQEDVLALQADVSAEYNQIMLEDSDFNTFASDTLPGAIQKWAKEYNDFIQVFAAMSEQAEKEAEEQQAKEEAKKKKAEEKKKKEEAKKAKEEEEQKAKEEEEKKAEESSYKVVTNAKVNLRKKPTTDADSLGKVDEGTTLTAYEEKDDWTNVKYGDEKGWIKTEFLEKKDYSDDGNSDSTPLYDEGTKITLTNTVNVRESMSESASKVAVAYSGSTVEVIMMYEEGWTKVKYDDKTGYIKSEYLK